MKQRSKALLVILSAAAMITAATFGTLAYFTDTKTVTNTFTVGKVKITLDEAKVNADGTYVTDVSNRGETNEYNLVPGQTYIKDPIVHVDPTSESCYVYVTVANGLSAIEAAHEDGVYDTIVEQMGDNGWQKLEDDSSNTVSYNGNTVYYQTVAKTAGDKDLEVFEEFKIDGTKVVNLPDGEIPTGDYKDIKDYEDSEIIVTGYAIQSANMDDAYDAWNSANGQFDVGTTPTP